MMYYMLSKPEFSQRGMAHDLDIHFGQSVNSFVNTLKDLGHVEQTGRSQRGGRLYTVSSPVGLISFYSNFRKMKKLDTFRLGTDRDEIIDYLAKKGAIFCLTTALSQYSSYFIDPAIYAYLPKDKQHLLEDEIKNMPKGKIVVNLYDYDEEDEIVKKNRKKITSEIRTVIDLYCDNKAHATEELVREIW